jgi:hypothetical protein
MWSWPSDKMEASRPVSFTVDPVAEACSREVRCKRLTKTARLLPLIVLLWAEDPDTQSSMNIG